MKKKTKTKQKQKNHILPCLPFPKTLSRCGCGFSSPLIFLPSFPFPSLPFTLLCIMAGQMLLFVAKSRINTHFQASHCITYLHLQPLHFEHLTLKGPWKFSSLFVSLTKILKISGLFEATSWLSRKGLFKWSNLMALFYFMIPALWPQI